MTSLQLHLLELRALWWVRWHCGVVCADPLKPHERQYYDWFLTLRRTDAAAWLHAARHRELDRLLASGRVRRIHPKLSGDRNANV